MDTDVKPVIVAFDGSAGAQQAARTAAGLFPDRLLLVVTAWEPGLTLAMASTPDPSGLASIPPDPEALAAADKAQREHATAAAEAGSRAARELGAEARALALPEGANIAATVAAVAEEYDAAAIIVGSRGLGRVASGMVTALEQLGVRDAFDMVVGTSAGAFAGAFFLAGDPARGTSICAEDLVGREWIDCRRVLRRADRRPQLPDR